jgi:hypothetical protein
VMRFEADSEEHLRGIQSLLDSAAGRLIGE